MSMIEHQPIDEIEVERRSFEAALYARFVAQRALGNLNSQLSMGQGGDETPEALFWRQPNGDYGVLMFNAAWWGWKAAKGLA